RFAAFAVPHCLQRILLQCIGGDMITRRRFAMGIGAMGIGYGASRTQPARAGLSDMLAADLAHIEQETGGRLGVAVLDTLSGNRVGRRIDERFPMCSTLQAPGGRGCAHAGDRGRSPRYHLASGDAVESADSCARRRTGAPVKRAAHRVAGWQQDRRHPLAGRLPKDWRVGDKTGYGERGTTNDVGIVWPPGRTPVLISIY